MDDCELEHNTFVEAISGFSGEDFDDSDFGKGAYIGIRILVDEEELNNDDNLMFDREYYEELLDDSSEGYLPDLLDLPRKDGYTFVFRNSGTTWDLVETNILEKPEEPQVYEIEFADFVERSLSYPNDALSCENDDGRFVSFYRSHPSPFVHSQTEERLHQFSNFFAPFVFSFLP